MSNASCVVGSMTEIVIRLNGDTCLEKVTHFPFVLVFISSPHGESTCNRQSLA